MQEQTIKNPGGLSFFEWMRHTSQEKTKSLPAAGWDFAENYDYYKSQRSPTTQELINAFDDTAFYCARINANAVTRTPLRLYVRTKKSQPKPKAPTVSIGRKTLRRLLTTKAITRDEDVEEITEHPLLDLLASPMEDEYEQSLMDQNFLLNMTQLYLEVIGRAYWKVDKGPFGTPASLWLLWAQHVTPWRKNFTTQIEYYEMQSGSGIERFTPDEVISFRNLDLSDPYSGGVSPLLAAWERIKVVMQHLSLTQAMLGNRARPDAVISPSTDDGAIGVDEKKRLENFVNRKFRGAGASSIFVTDNSIKIDPLSWPMNQVMDAGELAETIKQIARCFDVPLSMLDKDSNRASAESGLTQHARDAIVPRLRILEGAMNAQLVPLFDPSRRIFLAFDDPVPEDAERKIREDQAYSAIGARTINEIRTSQGYEPVEGGDIPLVPSTFVPLDRVLNPPETQQTAQGGQTDTKPESEPTPEKKTLNRGTHSVHKGREAWPDGIPRPNPVRVERLRKILSQHFRSQKRKALAGIKSIDWSNVDKQMMPAFDYNPADPSEIKGLYAAVRVTIMQFAEDGAVSAIGRIADETGKTPVPPDANIERAAQSLSLKFCKTTNATTSKELGEALQELRDSLAAGLQMGETRRELRDRVSKIFDSASTYRAQVIADTEAARATNHGQLLGMEQAQREFGVRIHKRWALSAAPCPLCESIAAEQKSLPLDGVFHRNAGGNQDYELTYYPPVHPSCQCSITEEIL